MSGGSPHGATGGSDTREARRLMEQLMIFSLPEEVERLRAEDQWTAGDRNSRTLAKDVDFRVLLTVLRAGAAVDEKDGDARVSLQMLEGGARLTVERRSVDLATGGVAVVDAGHRWDLRATEDCALLLTLAWPRDQAGV